MGGGWCLLVFFINIFCNISMCLLTNVKHGFGDFVNITEQIWPFLKGTATNNEVLIFYKVSEEQSNNGGVGFVTRLLRHNGVQVKSKSVRGTHFLRCLLLCSVELLTKGFFFLFLNKGTLIVKPCPLFILI